MSDYAQIGYAGESRIVLGPDANLQRGSADESAWGVARGLIRERAGSISFDWWQAHSYRRVTQKP